MPLIDKLTPNYLGCPEMVEIQGAFNTHVEALAAAKADLFAQLDPRTATWALALYEKAYGLDTDISKPYEYRRTRIISKMRGQGSTTKAMVQNVAASFSGSEVDVIEYPGEYRFEIEFTGTLGMPPNMDDLTAAIEDIKPAHLSFTYVIFFRTHAQLADYTHTELASYTHTELREEVFA